MLCMQCLCFPPAHCNALDEASWEEVGVLNSTNIHMHACMHARRERNDGLYRVITYLCAKMLDELLIAVLASIIFACVVFYGVRLQGEWVLFWLVYLTTLSVGISARPLPEICTAFWALQGRANSTLNSTYNHLPHS